MVPCATQCYVCGRLAKLEARQAHRRCSLAPRRHHRCCSDWTAAAARSCTCGTTSTSLQAQGGSLGSPDSSCRRICSGGGRSERRHTPRHSPQRPIMQVPTCCVKVVAHPDAARRLLDRPIALQLQGARVQRLHQRVCKVTEAFITCESFTHSVGVRTQADPNLGIAAGSSCLALRDHSAGKPSH